MKTELKFHNPDSLPTAGDPPWRFLVQGEQVQARVDEHWSFPNWWPCGSREGEFYDPAPVFTYRTKRPLPAPQPGGGGEAEDTILKGGETCAPSSTDSAPATTCSPVTSTQTAHSTGASNAEESTSNPSLHPPTAPIALPVRAEDTENLLRALQAADAGDATHWPAVAGILADEVRRLGELLNLASRNYDRLAEERTDEKRDTSTRLGYPLLEPWCAADKVMASAAALSRELEESREGRADFIKLIASTLGVETDRQDHIVMHVQSLRAELEEARAEVVRLNNLVTELRNEENGKRHWRWMQEILKVCPEAGIASVCTVAVKVICRCYAENLAALTALRAAPRPEGAIESAIQRFEDKERGIPQAHMAAELVKELRTALAAIAPRSETEGRDKALLDELERLASETECGVQVCCDNLTDPKKPAWWLEVEGQIVPVHLKEYAGNLRDAIAAVLAHDEKGAGE